MVESERAPHRDLRKRRASGAVLWTHRLRHCSPLPARAPSRSRRNFIIGAAVDFFALFFCLLLPEAALRFSAEDVFDGKAKVLPHRVNLQFAQARRTALNTEARLIEAQREALADAEEAAAISGGASVGAAALLAKGPLVKLALFAPASAAAAGSHGADGGEPDTEADGVAVLREPHEVLQLLHTVPAYVPMAHLAASARTGALASAADDDGAGAAGFVNPLAAAQAASLARARAVSGARRPSLLARASAMLDEATAPTTRAPRPVAPAQGFSVASLLSVLGGAPSAASSQGRRADALAGGRALRRSSVAASIVDRLGVVGVGMGAEEDDSARRGRSGSARSGGGARGSGASAQTVRNPLAGSAAGAGEEESGSDDTGDVTEEAAAAGADHAEPQNVGDPAPPPPPPRLGPRQQQTPTRRAEAVAAASGREGGEALGAAAAVSTTSATSSAAYAQARRKRLEQMGGAGSAAS